MKILNVVQGSPEWNAERARRRTASEASIMMGQGSVSRSELLRMKATGDEQEFSRWTLEVLFAGGHEVEALARPLADELIGDELYPVTATDDAGVLLASFDGVTMAEDVIWECKQWNAEKAAIVQAGLVPECDKWQVVQQLVVSRAAHCVYMVTDGTPEKTVHCKFALSESDESTLLAGWAQFEADLAVYVPPADAPVVVGRSPENLPALVVQVAGGVTASNLEAFRDHALAVFAGINRELTTDADFANADATVKWCKTVEDKLALAKEAALAQTSSIDELFRAIDAISAEARATRLELDKLVEKRKVAVRTEIMTSARDSLAAHVAELNAGLGGRVVLPAIAVDIAGKMKGKRNIASLRDAADTEAARAKVDASQVAARMQANLTILRGMDPVHAPLFPDTQALVVKSTDDLNATIAGRVAEAAVAEMKRQETKRLADEAEAARVAAVAAVVVAPAAPVAPAVVPVVPVSSVGSVRSVGSAAPAPAPARPSDSDIEWVAVNAVSLHFGVEAPVARVWLTSLVWSESNAA